MSVPGINKDYFCRYLVNDEFEVSLRHEAGKLIFYVTGRSNGRPFVACMKNIHEARGLYNKIVKELRKIDNMQRSAAKSIDEITEKVEI